MIRKVGIGPAPLLKSTRDLSVAFGTVTGRSRGSPLTWDQRGPCDPCRRRAGGEAGRGAGRGRHSGQG